jgi:molybdate/tungstate transport system substrate-binding protein
LRPEELLLTLLETGEADAIPAYKHEAIERGFPFISLPPQVNLGDPAFASYYKQASCTQLHGTLNFGKPRWCHRLNVWTVNPSKNIRIIYNLLT